MSLAQAVLILALCQAASAAEMITGRVVGVTDGDTLTVLDARHRRYHIRLTQIDAPEKDQDYGQRSKRSFSELVHRKQVAVEVETIDKYDRAVGKVLVGGIDANLEQVKRGMAWVYRHYAYDSAYFAAEDAAKAARVGLWSRPDAVPPREYRHRRKSGDDGFLAMLKGLFTRKTRPTATSAAASGACGSKRYCKEMESCEEAMHYLKDCGLEKLDGDGDGVPCEALCK